MIYDSQIKHSCAYAFRREETYMLSWLESYLVNLP